MLINANMPAATLTAKLTELGYPPDHNYLFLTPPAVANPLWSWLRQPWRGETQYLLIVTASALLIWPLTVRGIAAARPTRYPRAQITALRLSDTTLTFSTNDQSMQFGLVPSGHRPWHENIAVLQRRLNA